MEPLVFAHGSGWDEFLVAGLVIGVIVMLLLSARSRARAQEAASQGETTQDEAETPNHAPAEAGDD